MTRNPVYSFVSVCVQSVPGLFLGAFPAPNVVKFSTVRSIQPHSQGKDLKRGWCSLVRSLIPYSLRASRPQALSRASVIVQRREEKRERLATRFSVYSSFYISSYWKNNQVPSPKTYSESSTQTRGVLYAFLFVPWFDTWWVFLRDNQPTNRPYSYSWYWTAISLKMRLRRGVFTNVNRIYPFLYFPTRASITS